MANTENINAYQGQISSIDHERYGFPLNENLFLTEILPNSIYSNDMAAGADIVLSRIGVQAEPGTMIHLINQKAESEQKKHFSVKIGKTGFYEIDNVQVTGISFTGDNSNLGIVKNAIIDYIITKIAEA